MGGQVQTPRPLYETDNNKTDIATGHIQTTSHKKKKVEAWALSNDSEPGGFFAESMVYIAQGWHCAALYSQRSGRKLLHMDQRTLSDLAL